MTLEERICKQNARKHFWPELGGKNKPGWVLHHKDPSWRTEDPERYYSWNVEDLIPMTRAEHTKWHTKNDPEWRNKIREAHFGKHHSAETKQKMSEANLGTHWYNNGKICIRAKECPQGFIKGRLI